MNISSQKGFTLIELLVAIAIVGILASAGFAVYTNQIDKANDIKRLDNMKNILEIARRDSIEKKNAGDMFLYDSEEVKSLLAKMNYDSQTEGAEFCYFLGMAEGADTGSGHDNEIVIATWGKGISTNSNGPGVLAVGTPQAMANLTTAPKNIDGCLCDLSEANFLCEDPSGMQLAHAYFARVDQNGGGFDYSDIAITVGSSCGTCPAYPN